MMFKANLTFISGVLLCVVLVGCTSTHRQLQPIDYSDGIDVEEASRIADAYLRQHMNATLSHMGPFDMGNSWMFKIAGDVVPVEIPNVAPVLIDKRTGFVTWDEKSPLKH